MTVPTATARAFGRGGLTKRLRGGFGWRWVAARRRMRHAVVARLGLEHSTRWKPHTALERLAHYAGVPERPYARIVMDAELEAAMRSRDYRSMRTLEISGADWANFGFAEYVQANYPAYDVCEGVYGESQFDWIIAEQVFEHIRWPHRAVKNVWAMLKPGGTFLISTPFLVPQHDVPIDCSRWTELGLRHLLAEGGFRFEDVETHSWGNRACIRAALRLPGYPVWLPWKHSLENEPGFAVVVWAFARKAATTMESEGAAAKPLTDRTP